MAHLERGKVPIRFEKMCAVQSSRETKIGFSPNSAKEILSFFDKKFLRFQKGRKRAKMKASEQQRG
jgi:hypothetical protein